METPAADSWIRLGTPNDPDYVRDRLKGKGIKIYTKGELIEESEDHQAVLLEDPQNEYGSLNFELTDEAYESIEENLEKEDLHTQKNIDLIETGEPLEGGLKQQFPDVASKYDEEIARLDRMLIEPQDLTDIKTNFYGGEDAKATFTSKDLFIEKVEDAYPGDEGKDQIIKSSILRNTINKNAKQRRTEILGDQISITEGSHKMAAINGDVKIDMTDQGIYIDAGKEKDVTIKCRNFYLKNEDEDNITYGNDYYAHFGSNEEYFYGKSTEYFYGDKEEEHHGTARQVFYGDKYEEFHGNVDDHFFGDKLETHIGTSGEWYLWHKIEGFLGLHESLSLANDFELFLGLKQEIKLALCLELGAAPKLNLLWAPEINKGVVKIAKWAGAKIENAAADIFWGNIKFDLGDLSFLG